MNIQKIKNNKSGFTLLEIIIVIIIIGVLASLALPRLFSSIEFSRSTEAFATLGTIRKAMERCYLMNNQSYDTNCVSFANLDIGDPSAAFGSVAGAHFDYTFTSTNFAVPIDSGFGLTATRVALDGGTVGDTIEIEQDNGLATISRRGTSAFLSIK